MQSATLMDRPMNSNANRTAETMDMPRWQRDAFANLKPIGYGMRAGVVSIAPPLATQILAHCNKRNRNLKTNNVVRLSRDIAEGNWKVNGEPIIFDDRGMLLNGQHRLSAVIASELSIDTVVIFGVPSDTLESIDQGCVRTTGDVLSIDGESKTAILAAAASWMWRWENKKMGDSGSQRPTRAEAIDTLARHPQLRSSVAFIDSVLRGVSGKGSIHGFLHCLFSEIDAAAAQQFYELLASGAGLSATSPILALRNRLSDRTSRLRPTEYIDLTIRAWNLYRQNVPCHKLQLSRNGTIPQPE